MTTPQNTDKLSEGRTMLEFFRSLLRGALQLCFRVETRGLENYHQACAGGRALIVANHVSYLDGVLLAVFLPTMPLFVVNTGQARQWWARLVLRAVRYVTIDPANPLYVKSIIRAVEGGEPALVFPEGRITVTGALMKVYQGPGMVAEKTGAAVLPVHIDGPQFSWFSCLGGVARRRWFPKVHITILPPRKVRVDAAQSGRRREAAGLQLEDIMRDMVVAARLGRCRQTLFESLLEAKAAHGGGKVVLEDINRKAFTYTGLLRSIFGLSFALRARLEKSSGVGLMLPNTIAMVVSVFAMHLLGKAPALVNFTMGPRSILQGLRAVGVDTLVTARKFIEAGDLQPLIDAVKDDVEVIYLEDIREEIGLPVKLRALAASFSPRRAWRASAAVKDPEEAAAILFTSGSEGAPKGVVLSHNNLLANNAQVGAVIDFTARDVMLNAMPLFHSFGLLGGMVLPLLAGMKLFLYPSPLHYAIIPELAYEIRATILFGTNTFLAGYAKKAHPFDFNTLRLAVAGAEKLSDETRQTWFEKFGVRVMEGYGATETSPVISINTPMHYRPHSVGRLLPGMEFAIQPVPGIAQGGRLHVKGPNIMRGYILADAPGVLQPPRAEQGAGWYDTGDIVTVDENRFITIQGRAKRFAKIGGEMVSLTQVEALAKRHRPDDEHAAVAVPDAKKGEQILLFSTGGIDRKALLQTAQQAGAGELLVPRLTETLDAIPLLGTGKTDYNTLQEIAEQRMAAKGGEQAPRADEA